MARSKPTAEKKKGKAPKDVTPTDGAQKTQRVIRGSKRDWSQYSHNLPGQTELSKNGRQAGRNLIAWTRPRMVEKLLLHIEYESLLHNRPIPWDAVAHRLNPGSSGDAITQRLVRMRKELIAEGHLVPPYPQKPGGPVEDVSVRGLIRANPDRVDDAYTTRRVPWTEPIDDPKKPLGNAVYALQGQNDNEADSRQEQIDEDEDVDVLDQRSVSDVSDCESRAVQPTKSKDSARPARPARFARSKAKKIKYAEDEDDDYDGFSATENDEEADENEKRGRRNTSTSSSRAPRIGRTARSQTHNGLNAALNPPSGQTADFNYPYGTVAPEPQAQGTNHMSPYGVPNGVHWLPGPMGLPMMPIGMGLDMMGSFNTTPTRSSAFTTHATSPAAFNIEDASPRSAAFFQAHLNEYNSPTPRGHGDFNFMVPMPVGPTPTNASKMQANSNMSGNGPPMHRDPSLAPMGDGDAPLPQESFDAEFSSMFSDAGTIAKRTKKTDNEGE